VVRFTDATCLEATLCNTCGIGGIGGGSSSTVASDIADMKAQITALTARATANEAAVALNTAAVALNTAKGVIINTRLGTLETPPEQTVVYNEPRVCGNAAPNLKCTKSLQLQIWTGNADIGPNLVGGRFCVSKLGPGATFVEGTEALNSVSNCAPCWMFTDDFSCLATVGGGHAIQIGTCNSYSSITCAPANGGCVDDGRVC
jgi:hypothetical protein